MSKVTEKVTQLAEPVAKELGLEIWDVEYLREAGQWYLRVYIDKAEGVSINDCEALSRLLDPLLDEADPIPDAYVFEVSSAGVERELKRGSDFERYMGALAEVKHYQPVDGAKSHVGKLAGYDDGAVTLNVNGAELRFEKAQVAQVRLRME